MYEYDSRKITSGNIFICLPKGEGYCEGALKNGAKEIIKCSRKEMADLANSYYEFPSEKMFVVGVTGTNGKSSVTSFVHQALCELGKKSYLQGTLSSALTTPESLDSIRSMKAHLDNRGQYFVMEVSSHGIDQDRVSGIDFDVKCLTNITQDHLDYHKSFDAYKRVKLDFMQKYPGESIYTEYFNTLEPISNPFVLGEFNQENLKAALAILLKLGFSTEESIAALQRVYPVEGRFERIDVYPKRNVIVDYAHSPDGISVVAKQARKLADNGKGKLFICFGCGGDRDRSKRKIMAQKACEFADFVMITQDNPRHEDPNQIIEDIKLGISAHVDHHIIHDRKRAIESVLAMATNKDIVLIAGKGHEDYQIIGSQRYYFKDKEIVLDWCKENL